MTSTLERAEPAPQSERTRAAASAHWRRGAWTRRRVELRLAAREVRRAWSTSLLVIALVAIPMMLISGAAVFVSSREASTAETMTAELGGTDAWYAIVGGPDPSRWQTLHDPYWYEVDVDDDGVPLHTELPPPDDMDGLVDDPGLLQVTTADVTSATPGGKGLLKGFFGDAADARLQGRYELVDGRRPGSGREALVSPGALARLDAQLGDELVLIEPEARFTIVGVMKEAAARSGEQSVFLPDSALPDDVDPTASVWFSPEQQPTSEEVDELNRAGVIVFARDLVARGGGTGYVDPSTAWTMTAINLIVGGFTAYLVILLAGAGFAVSAKRQQHSLAVASSVGAARGTVFRIVLFQGTVLGLIGGMLGTASGVALAYPALALFDDGAVSSFWGFHVPTVGLVLLVLFATAVGTASALVPARAATRNDVLASLRSSRTPAVVRVDRPLWGTLITAIGLGATAVSALTLTALNAAETLDYSSPLRTLCVVGIIAGPLLFQIGVILAGHWLLSLVSRGMSRTGLALRIAARDAAAHPSRVVPAFAAIAACVFIASFALSAVGVFTQQQARGWSHQAPRGSVVVQIWADADSPIIERAMDALAQTGPDAIGVVRGDSDAYATDARAQATRQDLVHAELVEYVDCADHSGPCMTRTDALFNGWSPAVVEPADLDTVLGVPIDDATRTAFADGGALTLPVPNGWSGSNYLDGDAVIMHTWDPKDIDAFWSADRRDGTPLPAPQRTVRIPAQEIDLAHPLPWPVVLSPEAADSLDYRTTPQFFVGSFSTPPTQQRLDALAAASGQRWEADGGFGYIYEQGPPSAVPWLWLILGAAGALVLGAGGVALGLARVERRPDDATLAAVGAGTGIRRRIASWQAIVIVGIGSVTGTLAGVIPMWGIVMQSQSDDMWALHLSDTPWPWLALLALGLPLVIAAVSWILPPRRPDLTRRTAIA